MAAASGLQVGNGSRQVLENIASREQDRGKLTSNLENNNDGSSDVTELQLRSQREFYKDRKIIVRNVPPVTYEVTTTTINEVTDGTTTGLKVTIVWDLSGEVREFMGGHPVSNISISKKSRHAVVTLLNGEEALEVAHQLDGKKLLGSEVSVSFYPSDRLLCVAHLPDHFTHDHFHALVAQCAPVAKSYLKRDELTGESKGYGFVEYCVNREKSTPAREQLDGKTLCGRRLHCDFVNGCQEEYSELNSRCLLVENLPKHYRNATELRHLFSCFTAPAYCRILIKENDQSMGMAIVEYTSSEEATKICCHLMGHKIEGSHIHISYCVLGKTAIDIYNRLMKKLNGKPEKSETKPSLLPDPIIPHDSLVQIALVKSLTDLQPQLLTKLTASLQELQVSYAQQIHKTNKRGLLGPAPKTMNPLMSCNLQLGLLVLLALRAHVRTGLLSTLANNPDKMQLNLLTLLDSTQPQNGLQPSKPSLLGDPLTAQARILVQNLLSQLRHDADFQGCSPNISTERDDPHHDLKHDPIDINVRSLNINWLWSLGQHVMAIQGNLQHRPAPTPLMQVIKGGSKKTGLLGDASDYFSDQSVEKTWENQIHQAVKSQLLGQTSPANSNGGSTDSNENYLQTLQAMAAQYSGSMGFRPGTNMSSNLGTGLCHNAYFQPGQSTVPLVPTGQFQSVPVNCRSEKRKGLLQTPMGSQYTYPQSNNNYEVTSPNCSHRPTQQQQHQLEPLYNNMNFQGNCKPGYRSTHGTPPLNPLLVNPYQPVASGDINSNGVNDQSYNGTNGIRRQNFGTIGQKTTVPNKNTMTPVGQKRSYSHLLPIPEASPEGDYVGQHSQGIGGHYSETHITKRRRYNENFRPPQTLF